eukprot:3010466-Prymnesium_polylepis.1
MQHRAGASRATHGDWLNEFGECKLQQRYSKADSNSARRLGESSLARRSSPKLTKRDRGEEVCTAVDRPRHRGGCRVAEAHKASAMAQKRQSA